MGRYIGQSDVENLFGTANVQKWSQLDNDATTVDSSRVTAAIAHAEDRIDQRLRDSRYTTPLSGTIPELIKDAAARMAGVWLYESRGVDDFDDFGRPANPVGFHKREAERLLRQVLTGQVRLSSGTSTTGPTAPVVR